MALRSRVLAVVAAVLPLALAAGCSGGTAPGEAAAAQGSPAASIPAGPASGPQSLSETGSTLLNPVMRNWAAAYQQQHSNVKISTAATGSGKGIAEASAGQVDIGASDAYLSTQDATWDRVTGYGTTVAWPPVPGARAETHNTGMVAGCEATPGCVAYIGITYLTSAANGGLGYASLRNALGAYEAPAPKTIGTAVAGFVSTTPVNETISMVDGPALTGYPIVNYEYAIVSTKQRSAAKARDIKAFLHWIITAGNAPQYLDQFRFQRLPASIVSLSDAQIAKIG